MTLRVDLKGSKAGEFLEIKNYHGLENNADVVRLIITHAHREILDSESTTEKVAEVPVSG